MPYSKSPDICHCCMSTLASSRRKDRWVLITQNFTFTSIRPKRIKGVSLLPVLHFFSVSFGLLSWVYCCPCISLIFQWFPVLYIGNGDKCFASGTISILRLLGARMYSRFSLCCLGVLANLFSSVSSFYIFQTHVIFCHFPTQGRRKEVFFVKNKVGG